MVKFRNLAPIIFCLLSSCSFYTQSTKKLYFECSSYYYYTTDSNGEKVDGSQFLLTDHKSSYFYFTKDGSYIENLTFTNGDIERTEGSYYASTSAIYLTTTDGVDWKMGRYITGGLCSYSYTDKNSGAVFDISFTTTF
jgi:hypothetical protein